jgi:hypothetical protein
MASRSKVTAVVLAVVAMLALAGCPSSGESEPVCAQPPAGSATPTGCDDTGNG